MDNIEDFKQRIKDKNNEIDRLNIKLEEVYKSIEEKDYDISKLLRRINNHASVVAELEQILEQQASEIKSLQLQKDQWQKSKLEQQIIIMNQIQNSENQMRSLESELINTKDRLRKYEKVD